MSKKAIIEGALIAFGEPLSVDDIKKMFQKDEDLSSKQIRDVLNDISNECSDRGYELKELASGYRLQVKAEYARWISKLWEEKPPKYSKAILEIIAIIAYKQPITRAEIEDIRGVAVSTNTIRVLIDRQWIKVIAHKDVPGKPAVYGTTKDFLDYFNLSNLNDLPEIDLSRIDFSKEVIDDDVQQGFQLDQMQDDEVVVQQDGVLEQTAEREKDLYEDNVIDASSQFLEKQQENLNDSEQQINDDFEVSS